MHEPTIVGVPNGLGELPDKTETLGQVQVRAVSCHEVIEAYGVFALVDDERRAHLVVE